MTLFCSSLWAAELKVTVDKHRLTQDDYLTLTFQLINSDTRLRAEGIDPNVDLTLLAKAFDVGTPLTTFRYRKERTHGRATSELKVTLFPKRVGKLTIPAFLINGLRSTPISITAIKINSTQAADAFTESGWIKKPTWQGETQVLYLDLFSRVPLKAASFGGPFDSEPKDILLDKLPDRDRTEKRNGLEYQVTRSSWAITTQQNHYDFFIPDVWVETKAGKRLHFPVKKESLDIKDLPAQVPSNTFIGKPIISIENPATAAIGELYTWVIQIKSSHHASKLPNQLALTQTLQGQRLFQGAVSKSSTLVDQQLITIARYPVSVIPNKAEDIILPIVKMPYFDLESNRIQYVETSAHTVHIKAKPVVSEVTPAADSLTRTNEATQTKTSTQAPADSSLPWKISTAVFLCLWLITLFVFRKTKAVTSQTTPFQPSAQNHSLKERLLILLESRSIEEGLHLWKKQYGHWPELESFALKIQQDCYSDQAIDTVELKKEWATLEKKAYQIRQQSRLSQELSWEDSILGNTIKADTQ